MRRTALCLIALCLCVPLWAEQPPELSEVIVTSTRIDSPVAESPSAVTVITQDQIAASNAKNVAELINGTTGVVVRDNGPAGSAKTVSLRGAGAEQVLVMVDGVRMNSARDGQIDLSTIPVENIDHIEIVRGAESTLWGSAAIGGVINIITKKAGKTEVTLSVTNGSYIPHDATEVLARDFSGAVTQSASVAADPMSLLDNQTVSLSLAGKLGDFGLTGGGSFTRAANGYTWNDTTDIDGWRRLPNSDSLAGSAFAGMTVPLFGGELATKGTLFLSNAGEPGSLTFVSQSARQTESAASGSLSWKTDHFFTVMLSLDVKSFYRYDELGYSDPASPPASLHRTQTASLDLTQKLTLGEALSAVYGGSAYYDSVDSTNYATVHDRLNAAGFLSVPVSPTDALTITPSVRYDYFSDFSGSFSYSLSAVYVLTGGSSLRASFGSAYRVPTLNELYWYDPVYMMYGNVDLKPETSYNGEAGTTLKLGIVTLDASLFTRYVLNNIDWFYDSSTYVTMVQNLNETLYPGAELHAKVAIIDGLSIEASYTFVYSFLLNDGTTAYTLADNLRVPYAPINTLGASIRYDGKVHSGGIELRYVSDQYTNTTYAASSVLAGYVVVNGDYRFQMTDSMALTLALKNIFNTLYYTQLGYPMPPFSLEAGIRLHL